MSIYATKENAPEIVALALRAFPEYNGKKFHLSVFTPMILASGWEGGSRDTYRFVPLFGSAMMQVPDNGAHPLQNGGETCKLDVLPEGVALVRHCIFCGKDLGLVVYLSEANMTRLLPDKVSLTEAERCVLTITASFKSFCRDEYRRRMQVPDDVYLAAKSALIQRGLLTKQGAITPDGRNAIHGQTVDAYSYRYGRE